MSNRGSSSSGFNDRYRAGTWIEAIIIVLIFSAPLFTLSLPPVTLPGIHPMNATSLQTPTYAESSHAAILGENNWTQWKLNPTQSQTSLNYSANALILAGEFPASPSSNAISVSQILDVNLTAYPIMYMLIKVSLGVSYGIRFYSESAGGLVIPLWVETDALNHRPGTGQSENVQVNMLQLVELNTGRMFNTVTRVTVYVEMGSSAQSTIFSLQIGKFEFLDYPFTPARSLGSYHAIYVGMNQPPQSPTQTLKSAQIQGRLNASIGTVIVPYFIQGLSVYPGSAYTITSAPVDVSITIRIPVEIPKLFSDSLPVETVAIVIIAASGSLTQFVVENIFLNFFSRTAQTSSSPSQNRAIYVDYAFFAVLLPVSVIILVLVQLRKTKLAKPTA